MTLVWNLIKSLIYGIVQGITEWLPISSTGHLLLMNNFMPLRVFADQASNEAFWEMYSVVIQLGSILAVMLLFIRRLNPFSRKLNDKSRNGILRTWIKILLATFPAALAGVFLDDWIDAKMHSVYVIAAALIVYGILFILIEKMQRPVTVKNTRQITYQSALITGLAQMLALIPGTSRSGVTILAGTLQGYNRTTAAEFSFFMAIPVMFGAGLLKLLKMRIALNTAAVVILLAGLVSAFIVSVLVIRQMLSYIRRNDFTLFGYYRIALGIMMLVFAMLHFVE
ncbi:MAG: undecaprenyl-diphosphate phosphatase [Solobacterium sp.]|nr:undecaprenyl-diphosphate phosphatase [Solobacterium sp.]